MSNITIDPNSGFCFGVVNAIKKAEEELSSEDTLYCLGDIVHNEQEMKRLAKMGLIIINHEQFADLRNVKVLLRAHGEPPSTYETAKRNNIQLIDASCPVVLALQKRIKKAYQHSSPNDTQIVIYGKKGHAEVNGLVGQTDETAIVIEDENDLRQLDFTKNINLFSQTTKSPEGLQRLVNNISEKVHQDKKFNFSNTICRHVAKRTPDIIKFAKENDMVIFVSGKKSSNGKELYELCKSENPNSFFVTQPEDLDNLKLDLTKKIGICGATSTPTWLMEAVSDRAKNQESRTKSQDSQFLNIK